MEIDSMTFFFPWMGLQILAFYFVFSRINEAEEQLSIGFAMLFQEFLSKLEKHADEYEDVEKNDQTKGFTCKYAKSFSANM